MKDFSGLSFSLSQHGENHASCFVAEDFKCLCLGIVGLSFVVIVSVLLSGTTNKSSTPYFCKENPQESHGINIGGLIKRVL